jgi:hypothetical protein
MINETHIKLIKEIIEENKDVKETTSNTGVEDEAQLRIAILQDIQEYMELSRTQYLTRLMEK